MAPLRKSLVELIAAAVISGAVVSAVVGIVFKGYVTHVEVEIRSQRAWKEQSLSELLGPMVIYFDRTKRAFNRWQKENRYLEAMVMKTSNETIRDLLLKKGHLIPPELLEDAGQLIEHYDVWLEEFDRLRVGKKPDGKAPFVYAGPQGYQFPQQAEINFREKYRQFMQELYGVSRDAAHRDSVR